MAKLALCEFDVGQDWSRYETGTWVNHLPGIYYTDFTGTYSSISSPWLDSAETLSISNVGSVYAFYEGTTYNLTEVSSVAALNADPSFYWDSANDILYVRLPNFWPPDVFSITIGIKTTVAHRHWVNEDGAQQYDGDLKSLPSISKKLDPLFFGKVSFDSASIVLENTHGQYDDFASYDVFGQEIRLFFGDTEDSYSDLTRVWTGYIDDFTIGETEIEINASDPRRKLETPIPSNVFTTATYSDLHENDVNKPIPLAYGTIYNAVPKCVDRGAYDKATGGDLTFKLCDMDDHDAIYAITEVYYNGESLSGTAGTDDYHWDTAQDDLANATFVINVNADVDFDFGKVTVDFSGYEDSSGDLISKGLDVIKDMIETYSGTAYVNANFDVEQWDSLASSDRAVGLYVKKESTVLEAIEEITASIQMQFDVTGDGRYTARVYDATKSPVRTIEEDELFGDLELVYNSDEFLSRVVVEYAGGKTYVYDDDEETINKRFKYKRPKTFETILTSSTDAEAFAERVMTFSSELLPLVTAQTKTQNIDLQLEDLVLAYINRRQSEWLDLVLCRVEGVDVDLNNFTVSVALRVIEQAEIESGYILTGSEEPIVTASGDNLIHYYVSTS